MTEGFFLCTPVRACMGDVLSQRTGSALCVPSPRPCALAPWRCHDVCSYTTNATACQLCTGFSVDCDAKLSPSRSQRMVLSFAHLSGAPGVIQVYSALQG